MTCHPRVDRWPASIRRAATEAVRLGRRIPEARPSGRTHLPGARCATPGRSGLDLQRELGAANIHLPIIFITGYGTSQYPSGDDPYCGQDALPRDMNRLGSPELVLNPVVARATSPAWGDGASMCSGATTGGSAIGASRPLPSAPAKVRLMNRLPTLDLRGGDYSSCAGFRMPAHRNVASRHWPETRPGFCGRDGSRRPRATEPRSATCGARPSVIPL